jgi:hypothetical protein
MKRIALMIILAQTISLTALAAVQQIDNIKIASSVPQDQAAQLIKDIQTLKTMTFSKPDPNMLTLMEIPDANASTLVSWMESRVNFIVDENFALDDTNITTSKQSFNYPNPNATPSIETPAPVQVPVPSPSQSPDASNQVQVLMLNIGAAIYYSGKEDSSLYDVQIPGVGTEAATSPRIGIIKIRSGMFNGLFTGDIGKDPSTFINTMPYLALRLSTLIHEARHSDGNGTSLGFFHALCPSGIYANMNACDRNLNGPYQIETTFLNSFAQSCTTCSAGDTAAIQVIAADAASRQIVSTNDTSDLSTQQLMVLNSEISYCQIISTLPPGTIPVGTAPNSIDCSNLAAMQAQYNALQSSGTKVILSTMWDSTPEGTFSAN